MLHKDPLKRATIYDLFEDSWLTQNYEEPVVLFEDEANSSDSSESIGITSSEDYATSPNNGL